ncbi:MAG: hypothetical protein HW403_996 [Dehalococcoidia bacterium]|nr:hypothetical protein [Dehalococcoidia bacterium]
MKIAPNIHRVPEVTGSNTVLIEGDEMALIDSGIPGNRDAVLKYIESIGRRTEDLRWIIVTHFHTDHSGSANEIYEATGAQIVAHRDETEQGSDGKLWLRQGYERSDNRPPLIGLLTGGFGRRERRPMPPTPVHMVVEEGDVIPCLGGIKILSTPGHTPGSICPYLPQEKVIFAGDSILNNVDRLSRPLTWDKERRGQLDESLRTLRDLDAEMCCFGHGPPLMEEVMPKVRLLTDRPYNLPTWRIFLKNYGTLRRFRASTRGPGHWEGGQRR